MCAKYLHFTSKFHNSENYTTLISNGPAATVVLPVHELNEVNLELVGVHLGKLLEGERPAVEPRAEAH